MTTGPSSGPWSANGGSRSSSWSQTTRSAGLVARAAAAWLDRTRRSLSGRRAPLRIAVFAIVLLSPSLFNGLILDDLFERLVVERRLGFPQGRLDLFSLVWRTPQARAHFGELGMYPWWTGLETQIRYFRPVAAITHFVDYTLWPRAAWWMHAENLLLYGALVLVVAAFYRRFVSTPWVAGLATAFYAIDPAHAGPVGWLANRNALMATALGILSLLAHDRWRRERRPGSGALAGLWFALALFSWEGGLSAGGYLLAYALLVETGRLRDRLLALVPYGVITLAWRVVYVAMGFGVYGSDVNCDPVANPGTYLARAFGSLPLQMVSELSCIPVDMILQRVEVHLAATLVAVAVIGLLGTVLFAPLRRNRSSRFLGLGIVFSAIPLGAALPTDRYVFFVGLGLMGLIAQFVATVIDRDGDARTTPLLRGVCVVLILLRGVVSPLAVPVRTAIPGVVEDEFERMGRAVAEGPDVERKTVVLLNTPVDLFGAFLPLVRLAEGLPMPAHQYLLYAGMDDLQIQRTDARTLVMDSGRGWTPNVTDRALRAKPFAVGDTAERARMRATVRAVTTDGRARTVEFAFTESLDDPSLVFVAWGPNGFERFVPPAMGATAVVPRASLMLTGPLQPHWRSRAIVDDGASGS